MKKSDLIQQMSTEFRHLYKEDIGKVIEVIIERLKLALSQGQKIELRNFGVLGLKQRSAHTARNPKTGKEVFVEGRTNLYFKAGKDLKKRVNG